MNLLEHLRKETASAHERVEQAFDLEARTNSMSAYCELLERFYAFHTAWEPLVEAALDDQGVFRPRRKIELLKQDLHALGIMDRDLPQLAVGLRVPPIRSSPEAFGSMYVVEGSTLGGRIIARTVERRLGFDRCRGCSYFRCYGDAVGHMWRSFQAAILTSCQPEDEDAVILSAKRTFSTLHEFLCVDRSALESKIGDSQQ